MQKIIAIAADLQHLLNYCSDKGMLPGRFVHATDIDKMRGLRHGYHYIWISDPYDSKFRQKVQEQFRVKGAVRLPLDINKWSLTEFV